MKRKHTQKISLAAVILLLIILSVLQISWLMEARRIQDLQFNQKVTSVEENVSALLINNPGLCQAIISDTSVDELQVTGVLDSMICCELEAHNIPMKYQVDVASPDLDSSNMGFPVIALRFPGKKKEFRAQFGRLFLLSILLICTLFFVFLLLASSYRKERKITDLTLNFLSNMTHVFKTPISNILFANNMIRKSMNPTGNLQTERFMNIIEEENVKLRKQVDTMIQVAVMEDESMINRTEVVDVHEILKTVVQAFNLELEQKQGAIEMRLDARHHMIKGMEMPLGNAFSNIVDNALKYTNNVPEVSIETDNANGKIRIRISDNGIGIRPEDQRHIFDKFYRIHAGDTQDVNGTGLGLTYTRSVIEDHGGQITVRSSTDKGSAFSIELPLLS